MKLLSKDRILTMLAGGGGLLFTLSSALATANVATGVV